MTTLDVAPKNFLTSGEMAKFLVAARGGKHGVRDYLLGLMAYRHGLRVSELIRIRLDDLDLDAGRIFVRRAKGSMSTNHPMQGDEVRAVRAWLRERKRFLPRHNIATRDQSHPDMALSVVEDASESEGPDTGRHKPLMRNDKTYDEVPAQGVTESAITLSVGEKGKPIAVKLGEHAGQNGFDAQNTVNGEATNRRSLHNPRTPSADSSPFLFLNEKHRVFARQAINYLFAEIGKRAGLVHVHPHMLRHGCGYALANKGCDTRLIQDYLGHKDIHNTERYTRTNAARFERIWE